MHIILTPAGNHLLGAYTYRTDDQRLIGRIFTPSTREDFTAELQQFRADLGSAPIGVDQLAGLSDQSARYIDTWQPDCD